MAGLGEGLVGWGGVGGGGGWEKGLVEAEKGFGRGGGRSW